MDRFRELATFRAVAEAGSLAGAARRLGVSAPSVSRMIGELEARLGAPLLSRSTRALALTEAGARLLPEARRLLDDLDAAEAAAAGVHGAVAGEIRLTAPVMFGQLHLAPVLRDFLDAHPGTRATLLLLDRVVSLVDEGIDVALRIADLGEPALTARRIGTVRHVVVAAPALVARLGAPEAPADLARLPLIAAGQPDAPVWHFHRAGHAATLRFEPRLTVSGIAAALDAALAGWGVMRARSYQVDAHLAAGRLVELLPGHDDRRVPVSLVHREGRAAGARTRAFLDFAAPRLAAALREPSCRTASPAPSGPRP